jgi:hypothetical protein
MYHYFISFIAQGVIRTTEVKVCQSVQSMTDVTQLQSVLRRGYPDANVISFALLRRVETLDAPPQATTTPTTTRVVRAYLCDLVDRYQGALDDENRDRQILLEKLLAELGDLTHHMPTEDDAS